jgi:hypothetical protein
LDSYYLVDVTLLAMPDTMTRIANTSTLANRLVAGGALAVEEAELSNESKLLADSMERIAASNQTTFDADASMHGVSPTLLPNLRPAFQNYRRVVETYLGTLQSILAGAPDVSAEVLRTQATDVNKASLDYWNVAATELDALLDARINEFKRTRIQALGFSALTVLIAAGVAFSIGRTITRPLESLMRSLGPSAALVGRMGERVAAAAQSETPDRDETEIICEELNAQADNMRMAVLELARHIEGSSADRLAAQGKI